MIKEAFNFLVRKPEEPTKPKVTIVKINGVFFVRRPFCYSNKYFKYLGRSEKPIWWTSTDFVEKYCGFSSYEEALSAYQEYLNTVKRKKNTLNYRIENNSFDEEYILDD